MVKKLLSLGLLCVMSMGCSAQPNTKLDNLDQVCIQLQSQCIYVALQNRDSQQVLNLLDDKAKQQLAENPDYLDTLFETVPTEDPISVELELTDEVQPDQAVQRIYYYIYSEKVVRLRVIYDMSTSTPQVTGFWLAATE